MKGSVRFCGLLLAFFVCSIHGMAQTFLYVSPTGNDANPGTLASPLKTIAKAVSLTQNGTNTTIYLRGGTYTSVSSLKIPASGTKNGTAANYIKLWAYPGDRRPVLDFSGMTIASTNIGVQLKANYWYVKGIDIYGAGDNGMHVSGSNNIIEFCRFYENHDSGLQLDDGGASNQVINCDSYFNRDPSDGNADGFTCKLQAGTNNSFKGCRSWQNSDDGWDGLLELPNDDIFTSYDSCWCFMNGYLKTGVASVGNGNGFKMGGNQLRHNSLLTRCLSFYNRVKGFDQNNDIGDMVLYNCTSYGNNPNFGMNNYDPAAGKVMVLKNCVSLSGKSKDVFRAVAQFTTNSWQSPFVTTAADFISIDTTGVRGPRKPDGSLPDINFMHLVSGSDLINGGVDVGLPFYGTAPDLGAFEFNPSLPVSLTSFSAVTVDKGVALNWSMATESQNKGWTIERAAVNSSASWTDVGFVNGAGNSTQATKYSFPDNAVQAGTYYYRLKQTDYNGKISYSNILLVIVGKKMSGIDMASYPNPFKSTTTIRFNVPSFSKVNLSVYNEAGQFVKTISNEMMDAGEYQKLFSGDELAAGKYILKLQVGKQWVTSNIVRIQ